MTWISPFLVQHGKFFIFLVFMMTSCQQVNADKIGPKSGNPIANYEDTTHIKTEEIVPRKTDPGSLNLFGYYLRALYAEKNQDVVSAAEFYTESLAQDSANEELLQASFSNLYASGQIIASSKIAQQAEALNLILMLGSEPALAIASKEGDWRAVLALSDTAILEGGSQHIGYIFRAWAMYNLDQKSAAISIFETLSELLEEQKIGDAKFVNLFIAQLFILENELSQASAYLSEIAINRETNPELTIAVAEAYALIGQTTLAKKISGFLSENYNQEVMHRWIEERSNQQISDRDKKYFLAQSILQLNLFTLTDDTIQLLERRAQLAQFIANSAEISLPAGYFTLFQLADDKNDFENSQRYFNFIKETDPRFQVALMLHLYQLKENNKTLEAINKLSAYLSENSNKPILEELLADFYRMNNQFFNAIKMYESVLSHKPNSGDVFRKLGVCYQKTQQQEKAETAFAIALELNPNDSSALNYLGYWWADEGRNLDQAIELIVKAVELYPDNGYYADSLGWVYYKIGEMERAVLWLEHAVRLTPDDAIIHEHLGDVYWIVGRPLEARYKWQFALEMYSDAAPKKRVFQKIQSGVSHIVIQD